MLNSLFRMLGEMGGTVLTSLAPLLDGILTFGDAKNPHDFKGEFLEERKLLSSRNRGFNLTGKKGLSVKLSYRNMLVCGQTGTGKSTTVLIPTIFSTDASLVINDPSKELFKATSGFLAARDYDVKVLDYGNPGRSVGYNPLQRASSPSEISKVASTLVRASLGNNAKDPFWSLQAVSLLSIPITVLGNKPPHYRNLANVRRLVEIMAGDPKKMDRLVVESGDRRILESYKGFVAMSQNTFSSIAATALAALNLFRDEKLASITSVDTIDFDGFRKRKTALFVQSPTIDMNYYAPITSVLTEQLFGSVMSRIPDKKEQDIFFLLDEASSLNIPSMPITIANIRKYRGGIMIVCQDFAQIRRVYGKDDAEAIRTNCYTKLYFSGASLETVRELEAILGRYSYEDEKGRKQSRSLMTADEIRSMPINESLIICGHNRAIKARMTPFYENRRMRAKTVYRTPESKGEVTTDGPEFLPLK